MFSWKWQGVCIKSCDCNLNHREQFGAFILVKIEHRWPPLWLALRQNCSHLFGSLLSLPQAYWKVSTLFSAHAHTHTRGHTFIQTVHPSPFSFFFAPSPFSMPLLLYFASLGCLWQWHTVVLCDEPTSGAAVPHKGASTFNRYWQGLSLSLWSPGHLLYLHFLLSRHTSPSLCLPSFHVLFGCRHFIFHFSVCALILFFCFLSSSLLVSFCVVRLHTGVNNDPFSKVFTAHAVQYYRFIHLYIMFFF